MKLRKLEKKDAYLMLEWMHDNSVVKNLNTDFASKRLSDCEAFIEENQESDDNIHLAIADDNDEYMGTISLKHIKNDTAEFGIAIRTVAMGKGYSNCAMDEILSIAFNEHGLKSVYWCVNPENYKALRFYDKNGYKRVSYEVIEYIRGYSEEQIQRFVWYQITKEEREKTYNLCRENGGYSSSR